MIIDILLIILGLLALILASINDLKTREVPDSLSYGLIITGLFLHLLGSIIFKDFKFISFNILGIIIAIATSLLMFYGKQWGGGDAKLLIGIAAIFYPYPETLLSYLSPNLNIPFILILWLNILIIGSVYGIFYSIYLSIKNYQAFSNQFLLLIKNQKIKYFQLIAIFAAIIIIITSVIINSLLLIIPSILILLFPLLFVYVKAVENSCMYKTLTLNKLTEGDWAVEDIYLNGKKVYDKNSIGIEKKHLLLFKDIKDKKVLVKEGIPFVPSFLIAVIISLIFGNLITISI